MGQEREGCGAEPLAGGAVKAPTNGSLFDRGAEFVGRGLDACNTSSP